MSKFQTDKIIDLKGKNYITFEGILEIAHDNFNLQSIETEIIQLPKEENENTAIFKATVRIKDDEGVIKVFNGIGDANPNNTNKKIAPHIIRMAETRAIGRALRFMTGAGTVFEELGDITAVESENEDKENVQASEGQIKFIRSLLSKQEEWTEEKICEKKNVEKLEDISKEIASNLIKFLKGDK